MSEEVWDFDRAMDMLARVMFCETESEKGRSGRDARTHGLERDAPATF